MLYSTPDWVVNTIVPVVVAHVGWTVTLPEGGFGIAVTATLRVAVASSHPPVPVTV